MSSPLSWDYWNGVNTTTRELDLWVFSPFIIAVDICLHVVFPPQCCHRSSACPASHLGHPLCSLYSAFSDASGSV